MSAFDETKRIVTAEGAAAKMESDVQQRPDPVGPPGGVERDIPEWFKPLSGWLAGIVSDEAHILDLCLEKAIKIVEWNHHAGMAGIDFFSAQEGGSGLNRASLVAMSVPLAVELYREVLKSVNGVNKEEFMRRAQEALKNGGKVQVG